MLDSDQFEWRRLTRIILQTQFDDLASPFHEGVEALGLRVATSQGRNRSDVVAVFVAFYQDSERTSMFHKADSSMTFFSHLEAMNCIVPRLGLKPLFGMTVLLFPPLSWLLMCDALLQGMLETENGLNYVFVSRSGVEHGVINGPVRPFHMKIFLNKLAPLLIDDVD